MTATSRPDHNLTDQQYSESPATSVDAGDPPLITIGYCSGGYANTRIEPWQIAWDQLLDKLRDPEIGQKDGDYITRCACSDHYRSDKNALTGYLAILDGDSRVDPQTGEFHHGAPDPTLAHEVLSELDITHAIYSSHSNGSDKGCRYRVLILVELANKDELEAVVSWVIDQLHKGAVYLNPVSENLRFTQPWFLPRVPDARSAEQYILLNHDGGQPFPKQEALEWFAEQAAEHVAPPIKANQAELKTNSPIGRFNAEHGSEWMSKFLVQHGYVFAGTSPINDAPAYLFQAPHSSTGNPGVKLFQSEHGGWIVYSHHGEHDPLSHKSTDAFGLLTTLEFHDDQTKALETIGVFRRKINYWEVANCDPGADKHLVDSYRRQEREEFNDKYGLLMLEGKALVVHRELNPNTNEVETKFSSSDAIAKFYKNRSLPRVNAPSGKPPELQWNNGIFQDWLARFDRRSYPQPVFKPDPELIASTEMPESGGAYNLYVGANFSPVKGECGRILGHILKVWCKGNEEAYQYVIGWLATMIQRPTQQGRTVLVLRSGQGTGKNIILDIFDRYYGSHSVMLTKPEDLIGFNDHLATSVFVFMNEALWGGNRSNEGPLKSMITEDTMLVERKYIPKFKCRNCTHIVVATNSDWAVPVGIDDRRFFMLDLNEAHKNDPTYFDPLLDEIRNGGQEAFIHHLMYEVDLNGFDIRNMPQLNSATKLDHKIRTADSITRWWIDVLNEGCFRPPFMEVGAGKNTGCVDWPEDEPLEILTETFYQSYTSSVKGHHIEAKNSVSKKISELLSGSLPKTRPAIDGKRPRCYDLPSLSEARRAMDKKLGQNGPWHTEGGEQTEI